jgi:hypothetical protein
MVALSVDTGASITLTTYKTYFITPIQPVQAIEIKGIAAGLQVEGYGDVKYSFINDEQELQSIMLKCCLYMPKCTGPLLCPQKIGVLTGNPEGSFHSMSAHSTLCVDGRPTTILYVATAQLTISSILPR